MSRYLMVLWSGGGAVPPQLAVAKRLVRAGFHPVCCPGSSTMAETSSSFQFLFSSFQFLHVHKYSDYNEPLAIN